ncbi:AAA family ATPase, partial [Myxococcota bacterium]|nr:AAA family ATPase [Myxococcota bacterium]
QTLNQLLVEMDGFEGKEGIIMVAATNRPDVLDPALLRPGRFDRRVVVNMPDVRGREEILKVHVQNRDVPTAADVDFTVVAKGTPGFSGADLANLVNEAALLAARMDQEEVSQEFFDMAKDKILMGSERKTMVRSLEEKEQTAFHEAGHAVVALLIDGEKDPVHKASIIPRGQALGMVMQIPDTDRLSVSREFAFNNMSILLGGRIAEEIVFNTMTSGASSDLEKCTGLARRMICEWGMSEKLGPLTFGNREEEIFLGRELTVTNSISEATAQQIDMEVYSHVMLAYKKAKDLLVANRAILENVGRALIEKETLDRAELEAMTRGALNKSSSSFSSDMDAPLEPSPSF